MVKYRRTKKYGITDGVSPLSSEFFLSDSSVLSLRSSSCGQNCGGNRHVYAMWHACGAEPIFVYAAHMQYGCIVCAGRMHCICTVCAARKQIYVQHTSNISVREATSDFYVKEYNFLINQVLLNVMEQDFDIQNKNRELT